jgi:hypothetical protein
LLCCCVRCRKCSICSVETIGQNFSTVVMEAEAASAAKVASAAKAMWRGREAEVPLLQRVRMAEGARARQRLAAEVCVSEISCRRTCFCCSMSHCGGRARTP